MRIAPSRRAAEAHNRRMRITCAAIFLACVPALAYAQLDPGPSINSDHERVPKTDRYANYLRDEQRARQAFEKAAKAMLSPKFRAAVRDFKPGDASDLIPAWGEFITANGTQFIALQLAMPPDSGLRAAEELTFFGALTSAEGKELATYNEPISVQQSKGDIFVDRTLLLPGGKATGVFGLANRGEIVAMAQVTFEPEPLTSDAAGISRIIASADVHVLPAAQQPLDPFSFGGTRVEPKPRNAFRRTDEVWLFAELRNPKLGGDGAPHINTKVEIDGPKRVAGMFAPADATPLKGVAGHYGIGSTIDVSRLAPGEYVVKVTVMDTIAKQSFRREAALRIVE
jgi:hypothetical protein